MKFTTTIIAFLLCLATLGLQAATVHVTPTGAGSFSGLDWANAASGDNLRTLISNANSGDQIWVACGTYHPAANGDRSLAYSMKNGVQIFGSFLGTETALSQRDLGCGPCSILSGEIGQPGNSDNSYKLLYNESLDSTALIDGFRITGANDDRTPTSTGIGLGGGMYNHGFGPNGYCHPTVRNCHFDHNSASWGGGAFNNAYDGGHSEPTYINCVFQANHGYVEAGGMDTYAVGGNGGPKLYNCIFEGNTGATNVGAMYNWGGNTNGNCHTLLVNCVFANNRALNGHGGAFIADSRDENGTTTSGACTVTLLNCIVWNNEASTIAPQFYVQGTNSFVQATFSNIDMDQQNAPHIIAGLGTANLDTAPLFIDIANPIGADSCWFTADDGLRLPGNSPCVEVGSLPGTYPTDFTGLPRLAGMAVDMGPYEYFVTVNREDEQPAVSLPYPNPAREYLYAQSPAPPTHLWNAMGAEIKVSSEMVSEGNYRIDLRGLASGMYFLSANGKAQVFIKE